MTCNMLVVIIHAGLCDTANMIHYIHFYLMLTIRGFHHMLMLMWLEIPPDTRLDVDNCLQEQTSRNGPSISKKAPSCFRID